MAQHPAALLGDAAQLCCSGALFKQMRLLFILLFSFAALVQISVLQPFVSLLLEGGGSKGEHGSRREGKPYTQPGGKRNREANWLLLRVAISDLLLSFCWMPLLVLVAVLCQAVGWVTAEVSGAFSMYFRLRNKPIHSSPKA